MMTDLRSAIYTAKFKGMAPMLLSGRAVQFREIDDVFAFWIDVNALP